MSKNLFIALEGIDGTGKSTQARLLAEKLTAAGHKVYTTFEPSDGRVGKFIREILKGESKADERTIAGLFVADRLDHLLNPENGILKKMKDGYTVITDRYYFSSYAYHSMHMDMNWVIQANAMSATILRPDINVFIDVPPQVCMERISANRQGTELYETLEILSGVRERYEEAFSKLKNEEAIFRVDGNRAPEQVSNDIWNYIRENLIR